MLPPGEYKQSNGLRFRFLPNYFGFRNLYITTISAKCFCYIWVHSFLGKLKCFITSAIQKLFLSSSTVTFLWHLLIQSFN